jgi:hypothetical protein
MYCSPRPCGEELDEHVTYRVLERVLYARVEDNVGQKASRGGDSSTGWR